ncbi:MAG: response regulator [Alphaproteobacteria bacterium]
MRLLLIEDERELGRLTAANLERAGFRVDLVGTMDEAETAVRTARYDLTILDLGLPDGDGMTFLKTMRAGGDVAPILVLTARDSIEDRVAGLDAGADDYLLKPFAMAELLSRVKALLRRPRHSLGTFLEVGNVALDTAARSVEIGGVATLMPRRELALLEALLRNENHVVSREILEDRLYGFDDDVGPNALEVNVHRLRRRLDQAGASVRIHTVRGIGYLLEADKP